MNTKILTLLAVVAFSLTSIIAKTNIGGVNADGLQMSKEKVVSTADSVKIDSITKQSWDFWNYVPDRYIIAKTKKFSTVCLKDSILLVSGKIVRGRFQKGKEYQIIVETISCDGKQKGSWCDQRLVGSKIIGVLPKSNKHKTKN